MDLCTSAKCHDKDGVLLWFCFLKLLAGTTIENLIEAYSLLTESKLKLSLFNDNVLDFMNAVRAPLCLLLKANEQPSFQHFLHVYHGCMDARNEEFQAFVINLLHQLSCRWFCKESLNARFFG